MRNLGRRGWSAFAVAMASVLVVASASARTMVYVSAAGDGTIDIYNMDEASGVLTAQPRQAVAPSVMPMTVSPDKKHLYAVVRSQPFRVVTYGLNAETGALTQEAVAALPDSMPYVSTDISGKLLFTSSYGGNKIAVMPVNGAGLVVDGVKQVILTGLNAHSIVNDRSGKFVFATNLGSDQVLQFVIDPQTGLLKPNEPAQVMTKAGFGPRHIAISPDNKFVYVLTELTGHVIQFALDASKGTLSEVESVASVPADAGLIPGIAPPPSQPFNGPAAAAPAPDPRPKVWAADLGITPNGKFLYTTERTTNKIARFRVAPQTGKLSFVDTIATETQPRGIRIDPTGQFLVASGEKSDRIAVYKIDQTDGALAQVGRYPVSAGANWIEIVKLP